MTYLPEADSLPIPEQQNPVTPKPSALDKLSDIAGAVSDATQKGLSYANARRARETYRS